MVRAKNAPGGWALLWGMGAVNFCTLFESRWRYGRISISLFFCTEQHRQAQSKAMIALPRMCSSPSSWKTAKIWRGSKRRSLCGAAGQAWATEFDSVVSSLALRPWALLVLDEGSEAQESCNLGQRGKGQPGSNYVKFISCSHQAVP